MVAYQLWIDERGLYYVPTCKACGEQLRSSPVYDGSGPNCSRARCRKRRGAKLVTGCTMRREWRHYTGEGCAHERRPPQPAKEER